MQVSALIDLPGIGRKTANVFLAEMGKEAIGVDTHVAYISRALKWTRESKPEKIEKDLEKLFPKRYWREINQTCVHFGKTHMGKPKKDSILATISAGKQPFQTYPQSTNP